MRRRRNIAAFCSLGRIILTLGNAFKTVIFPNPLTFFVYMGRAVCVYRQSGYDCGKNGWKKYNIVILKRRAARSTTLAKVRNANWHYFPYGKIPVLTRF